MPSHAEVKRLIEARELEAAREACNGLLQATPDAFTPHLWLAHIALLAGSTDAARRHAEAANALGAPELAVARIAFAAAGQDGAPRLPYLERLVELEPGEPRWWRQAAEAQFAEGRAADAVRSLARAMALQPDIDVGPKVAGFVGRLDASEAVDLATLLVEAAPGNWAALALRATTLADSGRMDLAWRDIESAVAVAPDTTFPPSLQQAIAAQYVADEAVRRDLARLQDAHPRSGALFWCRAMCMDACGDVEMARVFVRNQWDWARHTDPPPDLGMWEHLDWARARALDDPGSPVHLQLLLLAGRLEEAIGFAPRRSDVPLWRQALALQREGVAAMSAVREPGEVTVSGEDRPRGTVLVFTGMRDQAWLPAHLMDLFLAKLGLRAVFLRDFSRLGFIGGLRSLGGSMPATVQALRDRYSEASRPLFTLGMSVGGLAAVAYAEALGARASLVFSPQSSFDPAVVEQMGDARARAWFRRLRATMDTQAFDLARILPRMPEGYRLTAYAAADNPEDRAHAERIAGCPHTRVRLLAGESDHSTLGPATAREPFLTILSEAFALDTGTPHA